MNKKMSEKMWDSYVNTIVSNSDCSDSTTITSPKGVSNKYLVWRDMVDSASTDSNIINKYYRDAPLDLSDTRTSLDKSFEADGITFEKNKNGKYKFIKEDFDTIDIGNNQKITLKTEMEFVKKGPKLTEMSIIFYGPKGPFGRLYMKPSMSCLLFQEERWEFGVFNEIRKKLLKDGSIISNSWFDTVKFSIGDIVCTKDKSGEIIKESEIVDNFYFIEEDENTTVISEIPVYSVRFNNEITVMKSNEIRHDTLIVKSLKLNLKDFFKKRFI